MTLEHVRNVLRGIETSYSRLNSNIRVLLDQIQDVQIVCIHSETTPLVRWTLSERSSLETKPLNGQLVSIVCKNSSLEWKAEPMKEHMMHSAIINQIRIQWK